MLNKSDIISKIAAKSGLTKRDSEEAFNAFLKVVEETVISGEGVSLYGIGDFEVKERAERIGENPQTKEKITIPTSKYPNFRISKAFKDKVKAKSKPNVANKE